MNQQQALNKASAISAAVWEYKPDEPLYKVLLEEKERLEKEFSDLQRQTAESPFYAARIRQMADYCQGLGSRLDLKEEEVIAEQRRYMREVVDFEQLWYSGMWRHVLGRWMGNSDELLVEDGKVMLERAKGSASTNSATLDIYEKLVRKITSLFYQYGKEGLLRELGVEDLCAPGHEAPKVYLNDGNYIVPFRSLVFFYESDCNNCENELLRLRGNYPIFQEKGIRVISVSADKNEATFRKNADLFVWDHKLCDFKGFEGTNFKNYGVIGTPMIFLIDHNGMIVGRYARVGDLLDEMMR
jgi:peroxiredoxin